MEVINSPQGGEKPVLLTDIDGVFLVCDEDVPGRCPDGYKTGPRGSKHEFYNPLHGQWLKEILPEVDWYWMTSHFDSSHEDIGQHLELPETAWVDFRLFREEQHQLDRQKADKYERPYDLNYPRRRAIDEFFPSRTIIWMEDELTQFDTGWMLERRLSEAPILLVRPDSYEGMQYFHISRIKAWLGQLATN